MASQTEIFFKGSMMLEICSDKFRELCPDFSFTRSTKIDPSAFLTFFNGFLFCFSERKMEKVAMLAVQKVADLSIGRNEKSAIASFFVGKDANIFKVINGSQN
jgi:hypothetical protein